jgi:AcrR family transcriptional regulator
VSRRGRPSANEAQRRRDKVLNAARAEFIEKGFRAATMDDIAVRANVSKRSLYSWHADKAALFRACAVEGARDLALAVLDPALDLEGGLTQYATVLLDALSDHYAFGMGSLLMREGRDFPDIPDAVEQGHQYILEPLTTFLDEKGFGESSARLSRLFESLLVSDLQQRMVLGLSPPTKEESEVRIADSVRLFLYGASAWQGASRRAA